MTLSFDFRLFALALTLSSVLAAYLGIVNRDEDFNKTLMDFLFVVQSVLVAVLIWRWGA